MPVDSPNYTQVPNDILGNIMRGNKVGPGLMASLEGSELKVLLAVCRLTFGFHQDQRRASLTMIQELTGLSRQGVINAANSLESKELIARNKDGGVTLWQVRVNSVDQQESEVVNSVDQVVNSVDSHLRKKPKKETSLSNKKMQPKYKKIKRQKPIRLEDCGPVSTAVIEITKLNPSAIVNGTELDFDNVLEFLAIEDVTADQVTAFGKWYEKTPSLKVITDQWGLFEAGDPPRWKEYQNGKGQNNERKQGNSQPAKKRSKYADVL